MSHTGEVDLTTYLPNDYKMVYIAKPEPKAGPVTIMDAQGKVLEVLSIEEFVRRHPGRVCRKHHLDQCLLCDPWLGDDRMPQMTAKQRQERASRAARARWGLKDTA